MTEERTAGDIEQEIRDYWRSAIIDMAPGRIRFSGYAIEDLMGNAGFADMVWLLTRGELPDRAQSVLLEAALVAGVDHGPQAPSIGIARMAITCGGTNSSGVSPVGLQPFRSIIAVEASVTRYRPVSGSRRMMLRLRPHGRNSSIRKSLRAGRRPAGAFDRQNYQSDRNCGRSMSVSSRISRMV